jgi:type IV secretory pathway TraG/TraD family ATPase VirD4
VAGRHDNSIQFGPVRVSPEAATSHFAFVGTTGSGKTTLIRLLLQSSLRSIGTGVDARAIVYDAKQDVVPQLAAIAPRADIVITNPFDRRGVAWDVCRDVREPQVAVEFAFTLIPAVPESQPFFSDAARDLVYGTILSFMLSGRVWTLADLLRVVRSRRLLVAVLRLHDETRDLIGQYLADKRLAANILSTIASKFLPFGPVAAAWEHAERRVSLTEWSKSEMIWVLGNSEISRTPLQTLNRCMVKRSSDITLNESESTTRRNWFVFDEIADAGKLDIVSLAKKGRSKGGCLVIGFQAIAGLKDTQMYGPYFSEEILAQFGHKFCGRVECAASAEWASLLVGDHEVDEVNRSRTKSKEGTSVTKSHQNVIRRAMLPSEIMSFPPCNVRNGLTGLFFVPDVGVFRDNIGGEDLFGRQLLPPADIPAFVRRPVRCQLLRPWSEETERRFGVPPRRSKSGVPRADATPRAPTSPDTRPLTADELDSLLS